MIDYEHDYSNTKTQDVSQVRLSMDGTYTTPEGMPGLQKPILEGEAEMKTINVTDLSADTIDGVIDELTYASYAFNRERSPDITPEQWKIAYGWDAVDRMEQRFQAEQVGDRG